MKSSKIFAQCSIDFQQVFAGNSLVLLSKRSCRKDSEIQFAINLGEDMQYPGLALAIPILYNVLNETFYKMNSYSSRGAKSHKSFIIRAS